MAKKKKNYELDGISVESLQPLDWQTSIMLIKIYLDGGGLFFTSQSSGLTYSLQQFN